MPDAVSTKAREEEKESAKKRKMKLSRTITTIVFALSLGSTLRQFLQVKTERIPPIGPPVFSQNAVNLVDLRNGSLESLKELTFLKSVVPVMYYASWSGQSRRVAPWYTEAATRFEGQMIFVSIDCWYLGGSCRKRESLGFYPRLIIYSGGRREDSVEYIGGLHPYEIIRFVKLILRPLFYISNEAIFHSVIRNEETVVVAYFDFLINPEPPEYLAYLSAAKQSLKKYVGERLVFGVISSKIVASEANMPHPPSLMLRRTNQIDLVYDREWTDREILSWVLQHWQQRTTMLINRLDLVFRLNHQPALILFLPLQRPYHGNHTAGSPEIDSRVHMLRRVASQFNNCGPTGSGLPRPSADMSNCCGLKDHYYSIVWPRKPGLDCTTHRRQGGAFAESTVNAQHCRTPCIDQLEGLACAMERRVSFFYMDSLRFGTYAEALFVREFQDGAALVIVDSQTQRQYVYTDSETISEETVASFVWKFLHGLVEPTLSSVGADQARCLASHLDGCVKEVTGSTFVPDVVKSNKDVLVLFYTARCVFCTALTPLLLRLAHVLRDSDRILIARFDASKNELHSTYEIPKAYPALVLYPSGRKATPILYPRDSPLAVGTLVDFLVARAGHPLSVNAISRRKTADAVWRLRRAKATADRRCERLEQVVRLYGERNWKMARRIFKLVTEINVRRHQMDTVATELERLAGIVADASLSHLSQWPRLLSDLTAKVREAEVQSGVLKAANVLYLYRSRPKEKTDLERRLAVSRRRSDVAVCRLRRLRSRLLTLEKRLSFHFRLDVQCQILRSEVEKTVALVLDTIRVIRSSASAAAAAATLPDDFNAESRHDDGGGGDPEDLALVRKLVRYLSDARHPVPAAGRRRN